MTAYELIDALRGHGIYSPPSIYRVLTKLRSLAHVHRVQSLNAFMACTHGNHVGVPIFAICEHCGVVIELDDPTTGAELALATQRLRFSVSRVSVEVMGLCPQCAA